MKTKPKKYRTTLLFSRSNFFVGLGSIFNVRGSYFIFNYSKNGQEADLKAIENDWGVIGQDLYKSMKKCQSQVPG